MPAINSTLRILSYGYMALWAACIIILGQYESLVAPAMVTALPLISLWVTGAYKRYDAWIDKVAGGPKNENH